MRFPHPGRAFAAFSLLVSMLLATFATASAATNIVAVRMDPQSGGGATITVQFAGQAPNWRVLGVGTTEQSVTFDQATSGPNVPPTLAGSPPLNSVTIFQSAASVSIALHLSQPTAIVRVRRGGPSTVFIEVVAGGFQQNAGFVQSQAPSTPPAGTVTEVIALKYADISEVAGLLVAGANIASNDNFNPQQTSLGSNSLGSTFGGTLGGGGGGFQPQPAVQNFGAFGQNQGTAQRLNETVAVDRRLNAIILTATPEVIAQYKAIIDKVDIPAQSVMLETEVVELDETASRNAGIEYSPNSGVLGATSYTIKNLQTGQGEINLAANVYAQVINGNGRIIAKPRILAQSGTSASILTGDAIPVITQVVVTGSSALTSQQVNYVNVGVSLQIMPRVSSDGYVTSHVFSEVSSVTGFTQGAPQISQRQAYTTATVRDGESFVVGGLLQDNEIKSLEKVPFIGDLPIIGAFFRYYSSTHSKTNLYIVVTPYIVHRNPAAAPAPIPTIPPSQTPHLP